VFAKQALHGRALHAFTSAVNQADDLETGRLGGVQILVDHRNDIARMERMQVDRIFDGDLNGLVFQHVKGPEFKGSRVQGFF
jgi:hypothetical protein